MKVFLPFIIIAALLLVVFSPGLQHVTGTTDVASAAVTPTPDPTSTGGVGVDTATPPDGTWVKDADVTFVGKTAARAGAFLDWSLTNYNWVSLGTTDTNPLVDFWVQVRNIVYAFFSLFVLITAFVIMITRGKNITVMRFIPRFIGIILLVTFSFALVQFLYQVFDIIQGFFLRNPDCFAGPGSPVPFTPPAFCSVTDKITQANLLNVGFNYVDFIGYRQTGMGFDESAMITLLLTKLTAITYYVMVGVLIVRKIILWFFIIISPIFPLLLLYRPVRNTGKIWIGEFFRWLLYAPLFSVLLAGLVSLWRAGIPLFSYNTSGDVISKSGTVGTDIIYPTAINILLGGPKANISLQNSINLPETFALYVICLIMLWVVIILPFILLRIFLDYIFSVSLAENNNFKQIMSMANSFISKPPSPALPGGPSSPPPAGAGLARALPFTKRFSVPDGVARAMTDSSQRAETVSRNTTVQTNANTNTNTAASSIRSRLAETFSSTTRSQLTSVKETSEITKLTNLSVPTMRDIAKYETSQLSSSASQRSEVTQVNQSLQKIANPTQTTSPVEREKYVQVREKLVTESQKGNVLATTILNAANTMSHTSITNHASTSNAVVKTVFKQLANPERINNPTEREQYKEVKGKIEQENQNGNQVAASLLAYINNLSENTITATQNISADTIQKFLTNISSPVSIADNSTKNTYSQLKEQLQTQSKQGNNLATSILSLSSQASSASPDQLTQLKDQLITAQKSGDQLATSILSNAQKESGEIDVEKVKEKLTQAKEKGDKVATVLLSLVDAKQQSGKATTSSPSIPVVNRLQTVSLDDYEAVKKTWRDSYKNVDVPQKLDKVQTRKEWIQSDISQITSTINLLSSPDAEKRAEGMKEVSGILPFLLIGGFSQNEIVAYLKAKLEAAKDISGELEEKEVEEGSLVDAKQRTTTHAQSMHMTTEVKTPQPATRTTPVTNVNVSSSSATSSSDDSDDEMPSQLRAAAQTASLQSSPAVQSSVTPSSVAQTSQVTINNTFNTQLLQLTNLSVPTMKDIAQFETAHLTNTTQSMPVVSSTQTTLAQIAKPSVAATPSDQQRFQSIREQLLSESQKGDSLASSILSAASAVSSGSSSQQADEVTNQALTTVMTKLAHPDGIPSPEEKEKVTQVKSQLTAAQQSGDQLALHVLDAIDHPEQTEKVSQLKEKLTTEQKKGNTLASAVLSLAPSQTSNSSKSSVTLPNMNRIQTVSVEDYESVKKIWKDNYTSVPVPQVNGKMATREEWITQDAQTISDTIAKLSSSDPKQQEEGMKNVGEILPFLLIGGFSQTEVVTYLKAKLEAAKDVSSNLEEKAKEEGSLLPNEQRKVQEPQVMRMKTDIPTTDLQASSVASLSQENNQTTMNTTIATGADAAKQDHTTDFVQSVQNAITNGTPQATSMGSSVNSLAQAPTTSRADTVLQTNPSVSQTTQNITQNMQNSQLFQLTNLSVPTMKDIARFETAHLEKHLEKTPEVIAMKETLERIAVPSQSEEVDGPQRYLDMRNKLLTESQKGDVIASSILAAADSMSMQKGHIASLTTDELQEVLNKLHSPDAIQDQVTREQVISARNQLMEEKNNGNTLASSVVAAAMAEQPQPLTALQSLKEQLVKEENTQNPVISLVLTLLPEKSDLAMKLHALLPVANKVQTVSVEDYEAVKKIWKDSYKTVAYPQLEGKPTSRKQWIEKDMETITTTIALLSNTDESKQQEGMKKVGEILPFLLIGGFSATEVVTYLKAKLEAAKEVVEELSKKEQDEASFVERSAKPEEKAAVANTVSFTQEDESKTENT